MKTDIDANDVIDTLAATIGDLHKQIAILRAQITALQRQQERTNDDETR